MNRRMVAVGISIMLTSTAWSQDVVITEFMAANATTLLDGDSESSDWIEIHNRSGSAVNLNGWTLTDTLGPSATPWVFPAVTLSPGAHLVVFASGKDRRVPGQELHTDFLLNAEGEYLGLHRPNGTVATEFAPQFPPQRVDVSYGRSVTLTTLLLPSSPGFFRVPTSGDAVTGWQVPAGSSPGSGWTAVTSGVGFDTSGTLVPLINSNVQSAMRYTNASGWLLMPFPGSTLPGASVLELGLPHDDGFVAWINGQEVGRDRAPTNLAWNSAATGAAPALLGSPGAVIDASAALPTLQSSNWLALHGLNQYPGDADFLLAPEILVARYETSSVWFAEPTPNRVNGEGFLGFAAEPTIAPQASARLDQPITVTFGVAAGTVRYTVDGTEPTETSGTLYTGPIPVSTTTTIRARAFGSSLVPSRVVTRTWIYPSAVLSQPANPPGLPSIWGTYTAAQTGTTAFTAYADYGMDTTVASPQDVEASLAALPSLCVTMDPNALWSGPTGVYANPIADAEHPGSAELINPDGTPGFQINCGIAPHGAGARLPWVTPKHSFRLFFRSEYGASRLQYPLMPPGGTDSFNTLVVKGGLNDAFTINLPSHDLAIYSRDAYARELQRRMGHASPRERWVHLYLNGLYWGVYQILERPDAHFTAHYHGGDQEDWDVIKHKMADLVDGDLTAWNTTYGLAGSSSGAWNAVRPWLDEVNFVDYFLLNFYLGTGDWMPNNWYAARRRVAGEGWRCYVWDAELALKSEDRTTKDAPDTPSYIYARVKNDPDFQTLFGDRTHRFLSGNGLLSPASAQALLQEVAQRVQAGIVAESARWGDWLPSHATFTLGGTWQPALQTHLTFLATRRDVMIGQLQAAGLYPTVEAPTPNPPPGAVTATGVTFTAPAGTIYYTLDGQDPRLPGGSVHPAAQVYSGPVNLPAAVTMVRARVRVGNDWSPLVEGLYERARVIISECLARNVGGLPDEAGDFEDWIEIHNPSSFDVDLGGWYLTDDLAQPTKWRFPDRAVVPAGRFLLVFADEEPNEGPLHATFKLSAGGEEVGLFLPDGVSQVDAFVFGPQALNESFGRLPTDGDLWVGYPVPTPVGLNDEDPITPYRGANLLGYPLLLSVSGVPRPGTSLSVQVSGAPTNAPAALVFATLPTDMPLPGAIGNLLVGPQYDTFTSTTTNAAGQILGSVSIPALPSLVGLRLYTQAAALAGPGTIVVSNALAVTVVP